jgi:hypothetical protein
MVPITLLWRLGWSPQAPVTGEIGGEIRHVPEGIPLTSDRTPSYAEVILQGKEGCGLGETRGG